MTEIIKIYAVYSIVFTLLAGWICLLSSEAFMQRSRVQAAAILAVAKLGFVFSSLVPMLAKWWPTAPRFLISSGRVFTLDTELKRSVFSSSFHSTIPALELNTYSCEMFFILAFVLGILFKLYRYCCDWKSLVVYLKEAVIIRKIGRVKILVSPKIVVPFAFRSIKTAFVMIPENYCSDDKLFILSIRHELQHHRQHDTIWIHLIQVLQAFFFWNPGVYILVHKISELQEFACDEALLGQVGLSRNAYSRCLLKAAQYGMESQRMLLGTTSMAMSTSSKTLTRRIEVMSRIHLRNSRLIFASALMLIASMLTTLAFSMEVVMRSEALTLEKVQAFIGENLEENSFPIEINQDILHELNQYLGREEGRQFLRRSLERREGYVEILQKKLMNRVPVELEAVALIESGFQNLSENTKFPHSAGMWQFIPQTARDFGLRVDRDLDHRLDIARATDAAARLLAALHLRFQDWRLAILAYNAGELRVQRGIEVTKSRDPWTLIRSGFGGDPGYLAKVMAGVLILKNPRWQAQDH